MKKKNKNLRIKKSERLTDQEKAYNKWLNEDFLCFIQVYYMPDCGCEYQVLKKLIKCPMPIEIEYKCHECNKECHIIITDPIQFYMPIEKKDFTLDNFKKSPEEYVYPQTDLLEAYLDAKD